VLRERRETAGAAAAVVLTADRTRLTADGEDLAVLTAKVVDAKGRPVPRATDLVTFKVSGPAALIGVGNGDPTSHEPDKADHRRAFNGLCAGLLQTRRGAAGAVRVEAFAPGLKSGVAALTTVAGPLRPAVI
jgi:beta-galactosidase